MKPQDVVVGMGVVLASDASRAGTVLKRDGTRVRVDFGDKTQTPSGKQPQNSPMMVLVWQRALDQGG